MCPSYCRIRIPKDEALRRFAEWRQIPEIGPLVKANCTEAVRLACDETGMDWRGQAVFVSEVPGWTLFQDLSGGLGDVSAEAWCDFAQGDDLVFAGYNDAICWAELIVIRGGRVLREFRADRQKPESNVNQGRLEDEGPPFTSWVNIARFVDDDELGWTEFGELWVYGPKPVRPVL